MRICHDSSSHIICPYSDCPGLNIVLSLAGTALGYPHMVCVGSVVVGLFWKRILGTETAHFEANLTLFHLNKNTSINA